MRCRSPFAPFALCLALLAALPAYGAPHDPRSDRLTVEEGAGFEISTSPSGATVFVDGIRRGKTPLSIDDLAPGEHRLILFKEGRETRTLSFTIKDGTRLIAVLVLEESTGIVHFSAVSATRTARPFAPVFLVDGVIADAPSARLVQGLHRIRARAFGFQDEERTVVVERGKVSELTFELKPAPFKIAGFRLERSRVNPANPGLLGESVLVFEASGPGAATATLYDNQGARMLSLSAGPFETWTQRIRIAARDAAGSPLADGEYQLRLEATSLPHDGEEILTESASVRLTVDSSALIRPATSSSGVGGLLFAPDAATLPAFSFQIELDLLAFRPYGSSSTDEYPPSAASFRSSPSDGWELAASVLIEDAGDGSTPHFGASVRRALTSTGGTNPFRTVLALRYGSLSVGGRSAFAPAQGLELAVPMEIGAGDAFILLAPSIAWSAGTEDAPTALLSYGAGWRGLSWTAALSGRTDLAPFSGRFPEIGPSILALELKLFPPPSVLVFSVFGGVWIETAESGAFAGAGFGILL